MQEKGVSGLEKIAQTEKLSGLERLAYYVETKVSDVDSEYARRPHKSYIKKTISYAFLGGFFPTEIQEKYAKIAEIPKTRMTWYSIGLGYAYTVGSLAMVYSCGISVLNLVGLGSIAGGATATYAAIAVLGAIAETGRAVYAAVKKRPIASLPIEFAYRLAVKIKRKVKQKITFSGDHPK